MRYFCDTEYDGFGGRLLSLALVPEDYGEELYLVLDEKVTDPWVERHVAPFFDHVPAMMRAERMKRGDAAQALVHYLAHDPQPEVIVDWPEDMAQLAMLLVVGPGQMVALENLDLRLVTLPNFSVAANSQVPHNALHDARALRDHFCDNHLD